MIVCIWPVDPSLLEQLSEFSPIVGIEGDSALLDLAGVRFDKQQLASVIGRARMGVANTVGAAWALAHYDEPLPVEALRLSAETVALLHELGIQQVAQLAAMRDKLAKLPEVAMRLDQFTGALAEPITAYQPKPEIIVERDLEYPLDRREMIQAVLAGVVEQITAELSSRQHGAIRIEFAFRCQPGRSRIVVSLFQPSASPEYLLELLLLQLGRLPGPLIAIRATVLVSARLEVRQRELFDDQHGRQRQLAALVDRISCRSPALRAVLVADAQPEHAFRYEPMTGRKTVKPRKLPKRPLLVEPRPIPVGAISAGRGPAQFCFQGEIYRITRSWGPERIQTGWWRSTIRRDYWRAQTNRGCFWLFCAQGKWFLHGKFD